VDADDGTDGGEGTAGGTAGEGDADTDPVEVEVAIRADALTLNRPADAPEPDDTSARNRFGGTVTGIDRGEAVALVSVDVGGAANLTVLVTADSLEKLALAPGEEVVASLKATATRAVPRE
jgi:molybdate transport system regulatory protein